MEWRRGLSSWLVRGVILPAMSACARVISLSIMRRTELFVREGTQITPASPFQREVRYNLLDDGTACTSVLEVATGGACGAGKLLLDLFNLVWRIVHSGIKNRFMNISRNRHYVTCASVPQTGQLLWRKFFEFSSRKFVVSFDVPPIKPCSNDQKLYYCKEALTYLLLFLFCFFVTVICLQPG